MDISYICRWMPVISRLIESVYSHQNGRPVTKKTVYLIPNNVSGVSCICTGFSKINCSDIITVILQSV
jgi:hypothetical protein